MLTEKEKKWLAVHAFPTYNIIHEWDYRIWLKLIDERLTEWGKRTGKTVPGLGKSCCDEPTADYPDETALETLRRLRVKVAELAAKMQPKAILLEYEVTVGEHSYLQRALIELDGEEPDKAIHNYLKDIWGEDTTFDDGVYWSRFNEFAAEVNDWREVQPEHISILRKYGL